MNIRPVTEPVFEEFNGDLYVSRILLKARA